MDSAPAPGGPAELPPARALIGALLLFALLTVVQTWPLARHPGTLIHDSGDALLNAWILWRSSREVPLSSAWWNAPAFHPASGAMACSEHLLGLAPLSVPVQLATGNAVLAYNAALLGACLLSATAAYVLGFVLTRDHLAGLVAGVAYGFHSYRVTHIAHIQILAAFGLPLALAALHLRRADGRSRWLALLGVAWLWQALSNGYYLLFFGIGLGVAALWLARSLRELARITVTISVASLPLVPLLAGYLRIHGSFGFHRPPEAAAELSADLAGLLQGPGIPALWDGRLPRVHGESLVYPGAVLVTAALFALVRRRPPASSLVPGAAAAVAWALALAVAAGGGGRIGPGRLAISLGGPGRPLVAALLLAAVAILASPDARHALAARTPAALYATTALLAYALALGPAPSVAGHRFLDVGPYALLQGLPGFASLRVPARLAMLGILALSALAALAVARTGRHRRLVAFGLLAALAADTSWGRSVVVAAPPPVALPRGAQGAVLEVPMGRTSADTRAMLRAAGHGLPLVTGYSGFFPPHYHVLVAGLHLMDPEVITVLRRHGLRYVVVGQEPRGRRNFWEGYVAAAEGARLLTRDGPDALFELPPLPEGGTEPGGPPLPIRRLDGSHPGAAGARDDDLQTAWSVPQDVGAWLEAELAAPAAVHGVTLALGPHVRDFPRLLAVDIEGPTGIREEAWRGPACGRALAGAIAQPREVPIVVELPARTARRVRVRLVEGAPGATWSVAEITVR